jgi:hypothetical protein
LLLKARTDFESNVHPEVFMRRKRDILWTVMVLLSFVTGIALTSSDWVGCEEILPDEYMDLSSDVEQDAHQSVVLQGIHVPGAERVGADAALPLSGPVSRPASPQRHQPGHRTPLALVTMSVRHRELRATDQRGINTSLFACSPECSSNTAFPPYLAEMPSKSDPSKVILRI